MAGCRKRPTTCPRGLLRGAPSSSIRSTAPALSSPAATWCVIDRGGRGRRAVGRQRSNARPGPRVIRRPERGGSFLQRRAAWRVRSAGEPVTIAGPRQLIDATAARLAPAPEHGALHSLAGLPAGDGRRRRRSTPAMSSRMPTTGISPRPTLWCARRAAQFLDRAGRAAALRRGDVRRNVLAAGSGPLLRVMAEVIARSDG